MSGSRGGRVFCMLCNRYECPPAGTIQHVCACGAVSEWNDNLPGPNDDPNHPKGWWTLKNTGPTTFVVMGSRNPN